VPPSPFTDQPLRLYAKPPLTQKAKGAPSHRRESAGCKCNVDRSVTREIALWERVRGTRVALADRLRTAPTQHRLGPVSFVYRGNLAEALYGAEALERCRGGAASRRAGLREASHNAFTRGRTEAADVECDGLAILVLLVRAYPPVALAAYGDDGQRYVDPCCQFAVARIPQNA
jgi:hypothetical protein